MSQTQTEHYQHALSFVKSRGHRVHELAIDGNIHRTHIEGHKRGSKNGYYAFWDAPFLAGYCGDFKSGAYEVFSAKAQQSLSDSERNDYYAQLKAAIRQREQVEQAKHEATCQRASSIWAGLYPANPKHPYAQRKHMGVAGLRQGNNHLVIPLYNQRRLVSLQFIDAEGNKRFLSGGKLKGSYFFWGKLTPQTPTIYVAEGIATGWAVHCLSDRSPVVCAMNAHNLPVVAQRLRNKWQQAHLIIAADNDVTSDSTRNVGVDYAEQAAILCNGKITKPQLPHQPQTACDWNDVYRIAERDKGVSV